MWFKVLLILSLWIKPQCDHSLEAILSKTSMWCCLFINSTESTAQYAV